MNNIERKHQEELIKILVELIDVIEIMKKEKSNYLLIQNEKEAKDWLAFLQTHTDKEELKTLEDEISNRFFFKFDVQLGNSILDKKRADLIKSYIFKSNDYLK